MHWSAGYIGIPYLDKGRTRAGVDCWGLACLAYDEQLGIRLPLYDDRYGSASGDLAERAEIAAIVAEAERDPVWVPVRKPAPFDILTFRRGRDVTHVGIFALRGRMLHVEEAGDHARLDDYFAPRHAACLTGCYRHRDRMERPS